jgi:hypothetical protein
VFIRVSDTVTLWAHHHGNEHMLLFTCSSLLLFRCLARADGRHVANERDACGLHAVLVVYLHGLVFTDARNSHYHFDVYTRAPGTLIRSRPVTRTLRLVRASPTARTQTCFTGSGQLGLASRGSGRLTSVVGSYTHRTHRMHARTHARTHTNTHTSHHMCISPCTLHTRSEHYCLLAHIDTHTSSSTW